EVRVAELTDVVDLRDVRVLQLRREPRLVEEHPHERLIVRAMPEDPLEHDVALDSRRARTAREKDLGHSTSRELRQNLVTVGSRAELGLYLRHVRQLSPIPGGFAVLGEGLNGPRGTGVIAA